jgi:hypothetical protein
MCKKAQAPNMLSSSFNFPHFCRRDVTVCTRHRERMRNRCHDPANRNFAGAASSPACNIVRLISDAKMDRAVAPKTKGNEIVRAVVPRARAIALMMYLQFVSAAASLATPSIALEYRSAKIAIR